MHHLQLAATPSDLAKICRRSTKKSTKRIEENDLPLLQKWRKSHPTDHRIAFYLSQTLMALRRWEEAIQAYGERIALGGYHVSGCNVADQLRSFLTCRHSLSCRRYHLCSGC
jgi:hypothetical protein